MKTSNNLVGDDLIGVLSQNNFFFEHIESRSIDNSRIQRLDKRVGVDNRTARRINNYGLLPAVRECLPIEKVESLVSEWRMQRDDLRLTEQLRKRHIANVFAEVYLLVWVMFDDAAARKAASCPRSPAAASLLSLGLA